MLDQRRDATGESGKPRRRTPAGIFVAVAAVLALLGLVALVSGGPRPGVDLPSPAFDARAASANILAPMLLVAGAAGALLALTMHRRARGPRRPYTWTTFVADVLAFAVVALLARLLVWAFRRRGTAQDDVTADVTPTVIPTEAGAAVRAFEGDWRIQAAVALLTAAALAYAGYRAFRRTARDEPRMPPTHEIAVALDESLEELRAEPDPRRAVIAAYARMERALGVAGLPRRVSEAPGEYMARVLAAMRVDAAPVARLTELFVHAKFDRRAVDETMRDDAIAALVAIRGDLLVTA